MTAFRNGLRPLWVDSGLCLSDQIPATTLHSLAGPPSSLASGVRRFDRAQAHPPTTPAAMLCDPARPAALHRVRRSPAQMETVGNNRDAHDCSHRRASAERGGRWGRSSGPLPNSGVPRASRGRVAEWPVTDPILPVLVLPQDNAMAKSIARLRSGERSRRRTFRQDPASG